MALWSPPAFAADADESALAFRRAELRERALGDLNGAHALYIEAAQSAADVAQRATAELRAASCLVRLGRVDDAKELAEPWAAEEWSDDVRALAARILEHSPDPSTGETSTESVTVPDASGMVALEEELEQTRLRLETAIDQAEGSAQEVRDLAEELRRRDQAIEELRKRLPPPTPETPDELLELRRQEIAREREASRAMSRAWTAYARLLHRDGRFEEARVFLYDALAKDKENADAKALLSWVGAPLGDREHLFRRINEVVALAREVLGARRVAEAEELTAEGRRRQERGDMLGSAEPLARAVALLVDPSTALRAPDGLLEEARLRLRRAEADGADVPSIQLDDSGMEGWEDGLRGLLQRAGAEVRHGLELRLHDLDIALPSGGTSLPPVPTSGPPAGWSITARGVSPMPLLAAWLRGTERDGFDAPDASVDHVGATVVALAPQQTQQQLAARLADLEVTRASPVEVEFIALSLPADSFGARLAARGLTTSELAGGGLMAMLSPADVGPLADAAEGTELGRSVFRAADRRAFRLTRGTDAQRLTIDALPVAGPLAGAGVSVRTAWRPGARGAAMTAESVAGGPIAPGGAVAVFGMVDPFDVERDLVVLLRVGRAGPQPESTGDDATGDRPELPTTGPKLRVAEYLLPASLARVHEIVATALPVPDAPIASRSDALRARLRRAAPSATTLEMRADRVLVVGPDAAHDGVRELLDAIASAPALMRFEVRVHAVPERVERALAEAVPVLSSSADVDFGWAAVRDRAMRLTVERLLAGAAGEWRLASPVAASPATVRDDVAHIVRSAYRRALETAPGGEPAWGRAESAWIDTGLLVALRPFGLTDRERVALDLSLRTTWIDAVEKTTRETSLGTVSTPLPTLGHSHGDLRVALGMEDLLVIAGLRDPLAAPGEAGRRLVVTVQRVP